MSHYLKHNKVDALEIDRIFLNSQLLQSTVAQGKHVYPDFRILSQDVFFALYKIYIQLDPESSSDTHQLLLNPLLNSPVLAKLRRRSVSSSADSFIALKRLLDFFLEHSRGRDVISKTHEVATARLEALTQTMSELELNLSQSILAQQNKAMNLHNMEQLLQDLYDFAQSPGENKSVDSPMDSQTEESDDDTPSLFEESLQLLDESYDNSPGDEAINERLDGSDAADQTFKGGLETEMNDRFSSFLKHQYLTASETLGEDQFISPLETEQPVSEKRVQAGGGDDELIASETFALSQEQEQALAGWKRTGEHRPPTDNKQLDTLASLTNPAANIPWDQALEDVVRNIDKFDDSLNELGIRKDTLTDVGFDEVIDIYRRLTSPQFKQMIDRIGRNKRYARKVQHKKRSRQAKPIDKIDRSDRIDDMIDDEYIHLALDIESFETDFYDRYLHDALLTSKMINRSDKRRGPIIVCYDGSGSMSGLKIQDTRTHILTLLEIAKIQKRYLVIIQFASKSEPLFIKELNPLEISARDVYDILDTFISGGTDFELPLQKALEYIRRDHHRKSDILFFTDGLAGISSKFKQQFLVQKEKYQFKMFTVIMHSLTYEDYGDIGQISDEILTIEEKDIGQNHDQSYKRIYNAI